MKLTGNPKITWMFLSWLLRRSVLDSYRCVLMCVCVWGWAAQCWQKRLLFLLNRRLSLLSLTAAQRLNSDTAEGSGPLEPFEFAVVGGEWAWWVGWFEWDCGTSTPSVLFFCFTQLWCAAETCENHIYIYIYFPHCVLILNQRATNSPEVKLWCHSKWDFHLSRVFAAKLTNLSNFFFVWN